MNDTPRTDAEDFYPHHSNKKVCDADFARQLERELNACCQTCVDTVGELNRLLARIKRLEEAGDELASLTIPNGNSHRNWTKAKETKP